MSILFNKKVLIALSIFLFSGVLVAQKNDYSIIPIPAKLKQANGSFEFNQNTTIYFENGVSDDVDNSFYLLKERFKKAAGFELKRTSAKQDKNVIICSINNKLASDEAYKLSISSSKIEIEAKDPIGFFYATQSIRQLLPVEIDGSNHLANKKWIVACCKIEDVPTFVYRGLHLDVARHFSTADEIKIIIDQLALLKLNVFHWHLTDDQGWRIEIKKYPKLTSVGAFRSRTLIGHNNDYPRLWDNTLTGGFYTQEEVKEVVEYAKKRFVTIIPEIEMPGHATAALAAYPELSCSGGPIDVEGRWGVFNDVFCTQDKTFEFLEDVLTEVAPLFPAQYIHIGGDECPKVRWERCHACQERMKSENLKNEHELQSYFVKRMEKVVNKLGKRIIGWDEILEGGIAPDATVMSWRGIAGGVSAAKQGHDVIMTPSEALYFDFYQSQLNDTLSIGGYVPIEKVYAFNPYVKELDAKYHKHILGVQANNWTEYMPNAKHRQIMIFPRAAALAEVGWVSESNKNFASFANRLPKLMERYDQMGLNYSKAFYSIIATTIIEGGLKLKLSTVAPGMTIHYTTDGSEPTPESPIYKEPIPIGDAAKIIKAVAVKDNEIMYMAYSKSFIVNKAGGQKLIFEDVAGNKLGQDGSGNLTDCMMGGNPISRPDWFSYAGSDGSITIDFNTPTDVSKLTLSSANQNSVLVYSPKQVEFLISEDGVNFKSVGKVQHEVMAKNGGKATVSFDTTKLKKVKLNITMYGIIPDSEPNSGLNSALFVDELIVE